MSCPFHNLLDLRLLDPEEHSYSLALEKPLLEVIGTKKHRFTKSKSTNLPALLRENLPQPLSTRWIVAQSGFGGGNTFMFSSEITFTSSPWLALFLWLDSSPPPRSSDLSTPSGEGIEARSAEDLLFFKTVTPWHG